MPRAAGQRTARTEVTPGAARREARFGLLETIRCERGRALFLDLHQRRLETSWSEHFAGTAPDLGREIERGPAAAPGALLRVAFSGSRGRRARRSIETRPLPPRPRRIDVAIAPRPREEPEGVRRHKSLDRSWVVALAVDGAFETLVWDAVNGLLEGTRTNVFAWFGSEIWTPPASAGLVAGVVRARVLAVAPRFGLRVHERCLEPRDLVRAEGLLLTGSGVGVRAVSECDGRPSGTPELERLARELWRAARERRDAAR
jgi:branched-chain amino acid aminotransferase